MTHPGGKTDSPEEREALLEELMQRLDSDPEFKSLVLAALEKEGGKVAAEESHDEEYTNRS